jgi:hypothetical protein
MRPFGNRSSPFWEPKSKNRDVLFTLIKALPHNNPLRTLSLKDSYKITALKIIG